MVEQQVSRHQDQVAFLGQLAQLFDLRSAHCRRLLYEHVLAGLECAPRELVVRRHRRSDDNCLHRVIREHVAEARGHLRRRIRLSRLGAALFVDIAKPNEVRELVEVAGEVLSPLAQADLTDARHSFQTFSWFDPFLPVALRRSTTTCARSTRSS